MVYKILAKVLANRLKLILSQVIIDSQYAFVLGRLITDNVLVSFETVHYIRKRRRDRRGVMSLKLDMSKAYDKVEWCFLEKVMLKLGFGKKMGGFDIILYKFSFL